MNLILDLKMNVDRSKCHFLSIVFISARNYYKILDFDWFCARLFVA